MNLAAQLPASQPCQDRLLEQVIAPGLCVACGACLGLCPHYLFLDGRVAAPDACDLEEGRCLDLCPVAMEQDAAPRRAELAQKLGLDTEPPIGTVLSAWQGRALSPELEGKAQYGGVVSELLSLALEEGLVDEAVLTVPGARGAPQGALARTREEVLAAAGSIYAGGGALGELNRALARDEEHPLAMVGLPCQVLATAGMKAHPRYPAAKQRLGLVIGLFCTMNLPARELRNLLQDEGVEGPVVKSDFPPPPAGRWTSQNCARFVLPAAGSARTSPPSLPISRWGPARASPA
jgi:coenzyme F420 hydrogenase subunit beta